VRVAGRFLITPEAASPPFKIFKDEGASQFPNQMSEIRDQKVRPPTSELKYPTFDL
jgi:hypothetical protein